MEPKEAIETVNRFIGNAKDIMSNRMEFALRRISKLRWWERWKASDIAMQCMGTGKYWNQDYAPDGSLLPGRSMTDYDPNTDPVYKDG